MRFHHFKNGFCRCTLALTQPSCSGTFITRLRCREHVAGHPGTDKCSIIGTARYLSTSFSQIQARSLLVALRRGCLIESLTEAVSERGAEYQKIIDARCLDVNVASIADGIQKYQQLKKEQDDLLERSKCIMESIRRKENISDAEISELKKTGKELREQSKHLDKHISEVEEQLVEAFSALPNNALHPKTPIESDVCSKEFKPKDGNIGFKHQNHIILGFFNDMLEFSMLSPQAYYLKHQLAQLERSILKYFADKLSRMGYSYVVCPDFCKSTIAGLCHHPSRDLLQVDEEKDLVLVGGASLEAFVSHLAGTCMDKKTLPVRWYSKGRFYQTPESELKGLFSVLQATRIHCIAACSSSDEVEEELGRVLQCVTEAYAKLDVPFRARHVALRLLSPLECLRVELELWSPCSNKYIPCGYIASYGDFLSKRMSMQFGPGRIPVGYMHLLSMCVASVPPVVACIVENRQGMDGTFTVPPVLQK